MDSSSRLFPPPSSSSSASPPNLKWKYDVFLNYRGVDTRNNFVGHLFMKLTEKGINTFQDDEKLNSGIEISGNLLKAIEESRFVIIIFSENYASSSWCLDELVKIIDCTKETGQIAYPVFYNVDPSDVRKQKRRFAKAFDEHERKNLALEKMEKWREALSHAGSLSGWDTRGRSEAEIIQKIVDEIFYKSSRGLLHVDDNLVGTEIHMKEIKTRLDIGSNDVKFVGIHGLGGIGKTTIAKVIYNQIYNQFEGCSYLANIREKYEMERSLVSFQKQLLYEILKVQYLQLGDDDSGSSIIQHRLKSRKVLVILDDVDHENQLEKLAGNGEWFGPGSIIIITTRDQHLLNKYEGVQRYEVRECDEDKSLEIFSWKAFGKNHPLEDYMELSNEVVHYAKGLPLALTVLGLHLCGSSTDKWRRAIDQLKIVSNRDINDISMLDLFQNMPTPRRIKIASTSLPSSSSSSASTPKLKWKYDVFLSFRGVDTRNNFVGHLFMKLTEKGITFQNDEKLNSGIEISDNLLKAIEESRFAIIIFSENYASSSLCLDELVKIIDCTEETGQIVYPVFYNVDPYNVRRQIGSFAKAFDEHEKKNLALGKIEKWKEALRHAANLFGWYTQNRPEAEIIQKIVDDIFYKLSRGSLRADDNFIFSLPSSSSSSSASPPNLSMASSSWLFPASSSSSSAYTPKLKWKYDVFLSFRGVDTRNNFVNHLFMKLTEKGINTFQEEEKLYSGIEISGNLLKAIEESRFVIIIFSENYASSSWCLDELVKIIDCTKKTGQIAYPVFYNVDPSDVRRQIGRFAYAFDNHEKKNLALGKIEKWREALSHAGSLAGWDARNRSEAEIIQKIVDEIFYKSSRGLLHVDDNLVGMEIHMKEIKTRLDIGSNDVKFVGIHGLGGIGKTTIAKVIYNQIYNQFEGCCYLANIREKYEMERSLVSFQKQLLYDILKVQYLQLGDDDGGSSIIRHRLKSRKVLVILDDVDHENQLEKLAGNGEWFGPGSIIIITTRDQHLLNKYEGVQRYEVRECDEDKSLEIFSWKAFRKNHPLEDYMELSNEVVHYAKGLPLTLTVLGLHLRGGSTDKWRRAIDQLKIVSNRDINDISMASSSRLNLFQNMPTPRRIKTASTSLPSSSSSSASTPNLKWKYDVFLSFRGVDTRNNFVGHLFMKLTEKGITFQNDEKLNSGIEISDNLLKAIEESRFAIIIFSENYASSSWCLDELVKIIDCTEETGQIVYPVFYNVDPNNVRRQIGSFAKAFDEHEKKNLALGKIEKWKEALRHAGNLYGWDTRNRPEAEIIQKIVDDIFYKLSRGSLRVDDNLVGMEIHMKEINSLLDTRSNDVKFVGIHGLGGIGKTTIAKVIYNQIYNQFEGCSYLANVRERCEMERNLVPLQKQLLYDILNGQDLYIGDDDSGSSIIQRRLNNQKVLVILDDVDHENQLEKLAGNGEWFGLGSIIIITTRDQHLLNKYEGVQRYEVGECDSNKSLEIFSWKAFKLNHPPEKYMELSNEVVHYAKGLPLALTVLGSHLRCRSKDEWRRAIDQLKIVPNEDVTMILKISYEGLNSIQKNVFLDIACFFNGEDIDEVMKKLHSFGFFPSICIQVLIDKSLITVSTENKLMMNDLVRDMGRYIVCKEFPQNPEKWSRLWNAEDILRVLEKNMGTEAIEGIHLTTPRDMFKSSLNAGVFTKMKNLRYLFISDNYQDLQFCEGLDNFSDKLKILKWEGYPFKHLPLNFEHDKLVHLSLSKWKKGSTTFEDN